MLSLDIADFLVYLCGHTKILIDTQIS